MKTIWKFVKDIVFALTHPNHWVRCYSTNKHLDKWINDALDNNPKFESLNAYTVVLNGKTLWIANYPFVYGTLHKLPNSNGLLCRRTVARLRDAIQKHVMESCN